jgi:hypothetical protein
MTRRRVAAHSMNDNDKPENPVPSADRPEPSQATRERYPLQRPRRSNYFSQIRIRLDDK